MPEPQPPIEPTREQALRYRRSFPYVFCILRPNDTATSITGSEGSYVLLSLNPQQISMREPFATAVIPTQGGGKIIESRGQIIKTATISGTTGYLPQAPDAPATSPSPPPFRDRLVSGDQVEDESLALISGYHEFHRLRYLFRSYGYERRLGNTKITLHYFDYKNEDFWRIEPEEFSMSRTAGRPYSYNYNISFKCIEFSGGGRKLIGEGEESTDGVGSIAGGPQIVKGGRYLEDGHFTSIPSGFKKKLTDHPSVFQSILRTASLVTSGLSYVKHLNGEVLRKFQGVLNVMNDVVGYFENVPDTFNTLTETPGALLAQFQNSLAGFQRTLGKYEVLIGTAKAVYNFVTLWELNAWWLEAKVLANFLSAAVGVATPFGRDPASVNTSFTTSRMRQGSRTDLLKETARSRGTPDTSPFLGANGLGLVTDIDGLGATRSVRTEVIGTGDDIYTLARRLLGNVQRFVDLVILNDLEAPYIVANSAARPANTLAWGDRILIPATEPGGGVGDQGTPVPASVGGLVSGTGTSSQLVDIAADWMPDQWIGYTLIATTGANSQSLVVVGNTATVLQLNTIWSITITPGVTTYALSMITFDVRVPVDPETRAYGSDLLLVFNNKNQADIMIGANKDLARVRGRENLVQAVQMRAMTETKEHPFHPSYGIGAPIGRPFTADVALLYSYFIKQSLKADVRIADVKHVVLTVHDGILYLSADIQPIQARRSSPVRVALG